MRKSVKKKHNLHHLWFILGVYGVWFAMLSGMKEAARGKFWKVILSLILGIIVYLIIEFRTEK